LKEAHFKAHPEWKWSLKERQKFSDENRNPDSSNEPQNDAEGVEGGQSPVTNEGTSKHEPK